MVYLWSHVFNVSIFSPKLSTFTGQLFKLIRSGFQNSFLDHNCNTIKHGQLTDRQQGAFEFDEWNTRLTVANSETFIRTICRMNCGIEEMKDGCSTAGP